MKVLLSLFALFAFGGDHFARPAPAGDHFAPPAPAGDRTDYLGQTPPGNTPILFAVSDAWGNRDMAISPDGNDIFYTLQQNGLMLNAIMHVHRDHGTWTKPEVAPFSGQYGDLEPAFSPDGSRLYFTSNRPLTDTGAAKDFDIWYVPTNKWGPAVHLPAAINGPGDEFYASQARNGNLYFTREVRGRREDIVMCAFHNGVYDSARSLSDSVNSQYSEYNAYVDPDERYLIFGSYGRKDHGGGDLYISIRRPDGTWGTARNLPAPLNSDALDYSPFVTPDGKYFFFTSNRSTLTQPFPRRMNRAEIYDALNKPGNGNDDIYWVKAQALFQTP